MSRLVVCNKLGDCLFRDRWCCLPHVESEYHKGQCTGKHHCHGRWVHCVSEGEFPIMEKVLFGFFSRQQREHQMQYADLWHGGTFYVGETGEPVEVTEVSSNPFCFVNSKFRDVKYVGRVYRYIPSKTYHNNDNDNDYW